MVFRRLGRLWGHLWIPLSTCRRKQRLDFAVKRRGAAGPALVPCSGVFDIEFKILIRVQVEFIYFWDVDVFITFLKRPQQSWGICRGRTRGSKRIDAGWLRASA